jgi:hypothetical protein
MKEERLHPDHDALLRFARGEVSPAERKAIMVHLLRGCEACAATVREEAGMPNPFPLEREEQSRNLHADVAEARDGFGLMLSGARLLRALPRSKQKPQIGGRMKGKSTSSSDRTERDAYECRKLLEQTNRELREMETEISRLLTRKRLLLVLRHYLAGLPPGC